MVSPLLIALKRVIGDRDYLDYLRSFRYPLSDALWLPRVLRRLSGVLLSGGASYVYGGRYCPPIKIAAMLRAIQSLPFVVPAHHLL